MTHEVCWKKENSKVLAIRYTKDAYKPPIMQGFPAQVFTIMPALHAFTPTGEPTHIHSSQFMFEFWMN